MPARLARAIPAIIATFWLEAAFAESIVLDCNATNGVSRTILVIDRETQSIEISNPFYKTQVEIIQFDDALIDFKYRYNPPRGMAGRFKIMANGVFTNHIETHDWHFSGRCTVSNKLW